MRNNWVYACSLFCASIVQAADERLLVGREGASFIEVREASSYLSIAADSIWIWDVEEGQNVASLALDRGGEVFVMASRPDRGEVMPEQVPELDAMLDGDPETAFDPETVGLYPQLDLYIDLGGYYGVEQIRFYPRQDGEHRYRFLQAFQLGHNRTNVFVVAPRDGAPRAIQGGILEESFSFLINAHVNEPNLRSVVVWPLPNETALEREIRFLRLRTLDNNPWEIAEVEVVANGHMPLGEFVSTVLEVRNANPVWGQVQVNGGDSTEEAITIQTRTGPDLHPLHYYVQAGGLLRRESREVWEGLAESDEPLGALRQGPVVPNPAWSPWQTLDRDFILSPPERFLQFRVRILEPGTRIEQLAFGYSSQPLAQEIRAEVSPTIVSAGVENLFVLTLMARQVEDLPGGGESGFRAIEIETVAEVVAIDSVLIQDRRVFYDAHVLDGEGFSLDLLERVSPRAGFVQVFFRGRIFIDGTTFRVQAVDVRLGENGEERVYQFARPGDIDGQAESNGLVVRLYREEVPLIDALIPRSTVISPNGDRINDYFEVQYHLFRLTKDARISFRIYDLSGHIVRQGAVGRESSGSFLRLWDGRDNRNRLVSPGMYIYQVEVLSDAGKKVQQGGLSVVY